MARPKSWIPRITQIIGYLEADTLDIYKRVDVERLFQISASQAKELMTVAGARPGQELRIFRSNLLFYVRNSEEGVGALRELERQKRFALKLSSMSRDAVAKNALHIQVKPGDEWIRFQDLPTVSFDAGRLTVRFTDTEDLCRQLMLLAKAATNEPDVFRQKCEGKAAGKAHG